MQNMKMSSFILILLSVILDTAKGVPKNFSACRSEEDTINSVMTDYNRHIRPCLDIHEPMNVGIIFNLMNINGLDELTGKFSVIGFFYITWFDNRIRWNPAEYQNVRNIFIPQTQVWRPGIFLTNSYSKNRNLGNDETIIHYTPRGHATWNPGDVIETVCDMDVENFPFDIQRCELKYVTWGFSITKMNFKLLSNKVNLRYFSPHGVWDILETEAYTKSENNLDFVHFVIKLRRRSIFFLVNMLVPVLMLGILNIFVFVIPVAHGDRIAYTLSVHLAIIVYLTLVSENLPQTSRPRISLICYLLLSNVFLSAFIIIFTIIGLRIHRKSEKDVPSCIKNVICHFTGKKETEEKDDAWKDAGKCFDRLCIFLFVTAFIFTNSAFLLKMSLSS